MLHQVLVSPQIGGAGLIAIRLAAAARARGLRTRGWVPAAGPAAQALEREHVPWRAYDLDGIRRNTGLQIAAWLRMVPGLIGRRRPLVHVHNPVVYRLLRGALASVRAKVVVHFHLEPSADEVRWTLQHPPDWVVTCARYMAESIRSVLGEAASSFPISVVQNAADLERFTPGSAHTIRESFGTPPGAWVVAMVANLAPHKGQVTALRAVEALKRRGKPIECWFVGEDRSADRAFEGELRALCQHLRVDANVRFLGFRSDVPDILRATDVFLLPSTHEGLPLSVVEAQATRVPVVGAPIPGILEVVEHGKTGFIVPHDDHVGYADHVQALMEQPLLRRRVQEAAAARVHSIHRWDRFEASIFDIYAVLRG